MNARSIFTQKMTVKEFNKHYWYKTELQEICRNYKISPNGTKAEIEQNIKGFLIGDKTVNEREESSKIRKTNHTTMELSLDTKLIDDGFKFNDKARKFFADYFNIKKFSFTKEMASAVRIAKKNKDYNMKVADLINIYENRKHLLSFL